MTYAFARDGGLPFSRFFAKVHTGLDVPLNALYLTTILVVIFGCIFLGSSSAFNAIVSASVVALGITYAAPPAVNCLMARNVARDRSVRLAWTDRVDLQLGKDNFPSRFMQPPSNNF
jgi:choline transport protein